ncbi:uncharacterized protein BCR38DRAFT_524308 [Pseudomassariella vexata]|uniref:Uncharacterized protein n=1 Tax=Pseudomassariella vexata TaxID=1141098 RepID=A0A1Y2DY83_9PEZI|nr:uncharacterized protein BCR38DRAFT_524308 [Pseudomassariella vexata]ORY64213.1 hypothetical protein BCR38DRAFT_524308 [Pseudomassariella vexata]
MSSIEIQEASITHGSAVEKFIRHYEENIEGRRNSWSGGYKAPKFPEDALSPDDLICFASSGNTVGWHGPPHQRQDTLSPKNRNECIGIPECSETIPIGKIVGWLKGTEPERYEDPELVSPFTDWQSPRSGQLNLPTPQSATTFNHLETIQEMKSSPQKSANTIASHHLRNTSTPFGKSSSTSNPLKGAFVHVTRPTRILSPPPEHKLKRKDVNIHPRLTDVQISQVTNMFSTQEKGSPEKEPDQAKYAPGFEPLQPNPHQRNAINNSRGLTHAKNDSTSSQLRPQRENENNSIQGRGRPQHKFDFNVQFGASEDPSTASQGKEDQKRQENHGRGHARQESHITTFSDLIRHGGRSPSPKKARSRSPQKAPSKPALPPSRESREKRRPTPLDLSDARRYGEMVTQRKQVQAVHVPMTPAEAELRSVNEDGSSSVYTDETPRNPRDGTPSISPLHIIKRSNPGKRVNVLKAYKHWKENNTPVTATSGGPARSTSVIDRRDKQVQLPDSVYVPPPDTQRSQSFQGIPKSATMNDIVAEPQVTPFTPLTPWIMGDDRHTRKASKTLFGDHGWLHDTAIGGSKTEHQKPTRFIDGIKKYARELAEKADFKPARSRSRAAVERVNISLDPREQSLLYCELEFILSNAIDSYIKAQLNGGRLDPNKLKKIADNWAQHGRPKVIGFRYDLETQIDLIALHADMFRFTTSYQINDVVVAGLLHAMKMNARAMRVRTLCQPDPVIAKQILDAQALLQLIDSPDALHISLAEVSQFFKVIIEREKAIREQKSSRTTSYAKSTNHSKSEVAKDDPSYGMKAVPHEYVAPQEKWAYKN